jgi:hypothetical protein
MDEQADGEQREVRAAFGCSEDRWRDQILNQKNRAPV